MTDELQYFPRGIAAAFAPQRLLGSGAFGHVYLARDTKLDRLVAVKVLADLTPGARGLELRQRFQREAAAMARVTHPNLAEVFDHGVDGITPYFVLEYLEGAPLDPLPPGADPIELLLPIADALEEVHRAGLVHRDVKPSNMMLVGSRPVLFDFGLMKDHRLGALTRTGALVGTPAYLPPEALNSEAISPAADWYSWGVCLYQLFEGKPPFEAGEVLRWISGHPPPPLRFHRIDADGPVAAAVRACLQADPTLRPAGRSALQLLLNPEDAATELGLDQPPRTSTGPASPSPPLPPSDALQAASSVGMTPLSTEVTDPRPGLPRWLGFAWLLVVAGIGALLLSSRGPGTLVPSQPATAPATIQATAQAAALPADLERLSTEFGRPPRFRNGRDGTILFLLPPVKFRPKASWNAGPATQGDLADLPPFLIGETEVTVAQYQAFLDSTGRPPLPAWDAQVYKLDNPVVLLHRQDAERYCAWAGGRLPSADEWQHAAGGSLGLDYPWGQSPPDARRANYGNIDIGALVTSELDGISKVGSYPAGASPWGMLDMAGNVAEITSSRDPENSDGFVACGGSWLAQAEWLRTHFRRGWPDNGGVSSIGFRLARDAPPALRAEAEAIQPPAP